MYAVWPSYFLLYLSGKKKLYANLFFDLNTPLLAIKFFKEQNWNLFKSLNTVWHSYLFIHVFFKKEMQIKCKLTLFSVGI